MLPEDVPDRCARGRHDPEFAELAEDACISPSRRLRHLKYKLPYLGRCSRSPCSFLWLLVRGCTEPHLECAKLYNRDEMPQLISHGLPKPDQFLSLLWGQRHLLGELGSEDLVLNGEVLDLGDELIVVRSAKGQHFRQTCGIHPQSKARIGFCTPGNADFSRIQSSERETLCHIFEHTPVNEPGG